jgi:hypothetical protein
LCIFLQALSELDQKVASNSLLLLADDSHSLIFFQIPSVYFCRRKCHRACIRAKVAAVYVFGDHVSPVVDRVQNLPFLSVP